MESTGCFQLEIGRAIEKLRSHQSQSPHHYVNRLLRAASACGAESVQVRSDSGRTRVEFSGAACDPERLAHLLEELFRNHSSAAHELANAANLAFGISGAKVELQIDSGELAKVLVRKANGQSEVYQIQSRGVSKTVFQLERSSGQQLKTFGTNSEEYLSVVRRFRLAPFAVSINKEKPPRHCAWGRRREKGIDSREGVRLRKGAFSFGTYVCKHQHVAEVRLYDAEPTRNGIGLKTQSANTLVRVGEPRTVGELDCCRLAFGLRADSSLDSTVAWVYRGETLQVFPARLALPGIELAIDASDLQLDATQEKLVQNELFQTRWKEAKDEFQLFAAALQTAYGSKSASSVVSQAFFDKTVRWVEHYREMRAQQNLEHGGALSS